MDPLAKKYPHQSTYVFAANNPIYLIDIEGKGAEPPKKTNIYILLPFSEKASRYADNTIKENNNNPKTNFYVIKAESLADANKQLNDYLGDIKADNIVITGHGPGGAEDHSMINTGKVKIRPDALSYYNGYKDGKIPSKDELMKWGGLSKELVDEIEALKDIGNHIKDRGSLVITSCGGANDNRFGDYITKIIDSKIFLYLNSDNSQIQYENNMIKLNGSIRNRKPIDGWLRYHKENDPVEKTVKVNTVKVNKVIMNNNDTSKPAIQEDNNDN